MMIAAQLALSIVTVCSWLYWRIWVLVTVVLTAVLWDSKSLWNKSACVVGRCLWAEVPERAPFLLCLSLLLVLHVSRLRSLGNKLLREGFGSKGNN